MFQQKIKIPLFLYKGSNYNLANLTPLFNDKELLWNTLDRYTKKLATQPKEIEGTFDTLIAYRELGPVEIDYTLDGAIKVTETQQSS